ncbi:MAG TPA: type II secretion system F family protein [Terriglobales bacterium]|nr:type II secretion system F family protein [Terriglobales bacterium]
MITTLAVLAFLAVALLVYVAASAVDQRSSKARLLRERLVAVETARSRRPNEELDLLRDELLSEIPALQHLLQSTSSVSRLQMLLSQAGMKMRPGKFLLVSLFLATGPALLVFRFTRVPMYALMASLAGALLPYIYARWMKARRFHKFEERFPEAIDLLGRSTRAGHAFTTSLELISNELGEPVAGEFKKLFDEQRFGLPLRDALLNLSHRLPLIDVRFFVTAVLLQRETGGNLAEILDKLSYTIRERFKILRQVRVFTAQGRMTLLILMVLPIGLVLVMSTLNGNFMHVLFTDPLGHWLVMIGITFQVIGFLIIRKIIHIRV